MRLAKVGLGLAIAVGALAPVVGVRAVVSEYTIALPVIRNGRMRDPQDVDALYASTLFLQSLTHYAQWQECLDAREFVAGVSLPYPIGDVVVSIACELVQGHNVTQQTHLAGILALYWTFSRSEGDWRNDWVTWLPDSIQTDAELVGAWLATGDW